jgi:hypothetical protein
MKGKYITLQILLACLSKPANTKKDIHAQLEETIAERKRIMERLKGISQAARVIDIYLGNEKAA